MRVVKVAPKRFVIDFFGDAELHKLLEILALLKGQSPESQENIQQSKEMVIFELLDTSDCDCGRC